MIRSVKFSNDGNKAYTASDDGEIKLTDLSKMKEIKSYGHGLGVNSLDINPVDDKLIVSWYLVSYEKLAGLHRETLGHAFRAVHRAVQPLRQKQ